MTTLVKHVGPERSDELAKLCMQRFIRSVLRVMVVCELEKMGSYDAGNSSNKKKRYVGTVTMVASS